MDDPEFSTAFDEILKRPVCLRRRSPEVPKREYEMPARLNHPGILAIYDVRPDHLVTEAVAGTRLSDFINIPGDRRAFTPRFQEMLTGPLLSAVNFAHEHGVVHGFLHPGNIWLFPYDELRVWGFGFTRLEAASSDPGWQYASPEVKRGEKPTRRSDIWSLGAMFHLLFCGRLPGQGGDTSAPDWVKGCVDGRYFSLWEVQEEIFSMAKPGISTSNESLLHTTLANNYFRQQKFQLAVLEWHKALALDSDNAIARNNLGVVLWREGQLQEAKECFQRAGSHFNSGLLLLSEREFREAEQFLRLSTVEKPSLAAGYLALGECLLGLGKIPDAIEEFQKSLILNVHSARAMRNLAEAFGRLGRQQEADSYQDRALEAEDQDLELHPIVLETKAG